MEPHIQQRNVRKLPFPLLALLMLRTKRLNFSPTDPLNLDEFPLSTRRQLVQDFFPYADKEVCKVVSPEMFDRSALIQAMKAILLSVEFNPNYVRYFNERSLNFIGELMDNPLVDLAREKWDKLSFEDREKVVSEVSTLQDKTYSPERFTFTLNKIVLSSNTGAANNLGKAFGSHGNDKIAINTDSAKGWDDFAVVLATLIHEKIHIHQVQLTRAWMLGDLKSDDFLAQQGALFAEYFYPPAKGRHLRFSAPTDFILDFSKPVERQAYTVSTDIAYAVATGDLGTVIRDFPLHASDEELARSWRGLNRYPLGWSKLTA